MARAPTGLSLQKYENCGKVQLPKEGGKMVINEQFWDKFIGYAKAFPHYTYDKISHSYKLQQNYEEADIYDVLNFIREKVNGGWTYTADFIEKTDNAILKEEKRQRLDAYAQEC